MGTINKKIKYSCVLDYNPTMAIQSLIWLESLIELNNIEPNDIYIHIIGNTPEKLLAQYEDKGINIVHSNVFDIRNRYCNKLVQLDTFKNIEFDYVFLMDCDTAVVSLNDLLLEDDVHAKIVDFPNPPLEILKNIFKEAGLDLIEEKTSFKIDEGDTTDFNNCNGGLYIISKSFFNDLASEWIKYALWSIDKANLFTEKYSKHADQVGFSLAMASLNKRVSHLGIEWNFPTHVSKILLQNIKPKIIHFHQNLTSFSNLRYIGLPSVDRSITEINSILIKKESLFENDIQSHKRDINSDDLNTAFKQVKRPDLLQFIVDVSRKELGFYTSHYPRVFEYSWLLEQLENVKESSVLDIGAGVCPLPLCLNEQGLNVTTIDSHSKERLIKDKENWNEWGYLDYSAIAKNVKSKNIEFSKYRNSKLFDYIYSISVIEHMPRAIRVKVLQKASKLLRKRGVILLTIDLIPNTENLWNLSENKEVEPIHEHGNINFLKKELKDCGFEISEEHVHKNIKDSRTDVYYVKAILKRKSFFKNVFK